MATNSAQIDATVEIVTPENIAFHYQVAGPFRRFPAFMLDMLIRAGVFTLFMIVLGFAGALTRMTGLTFAGSAIFWFLLDWFYGGVFETWMNGQTPGKWVLGIRVLSVDGQPINGIQAIMRNILRTIDVMPVFTCMLGLIAMTLNRRFQRIGDMVCGTIVVVEERRWLTGVAKMDDARVAQLANYIPADYRVSRTLAKTLAAYVDRRRFFSI
ncbi:MAG: RDD family protein, partial [Planctomycetia bacterium]|nr:RDD family protein [Planctomycetia bacterium]